MSEYICQWVPEINHYKYQHVIIAEKKLGRKLREGEHVHHIDFNKKNNDLSNLMVFRTNEDHSRYHGFLRGKHVPVLLEPEPNVFTCPKRLCPICGNELDNKADTCRDCYLGKKHKRVDDRITREDLKKAIRNESFNSIARRYGVSDNGVRKWCKRYGLPITKREIDNISDSQWKFV